MKAAKLPIRVFMIGTRESQMKFSPNVRRLADGVFLVCMWTSRETLADWLAHRDKPRTHFEIETQMAFAALVHTPAMRYVLVDPTPEDNPLDNTFALASFPAERRIDLHSFADVGTAWADPSEGMQILRRFALSHPEIKPFELVKTFASFLNQSGRELQATGSFDQAWDFVQERLESRNASVSMVALVRGVWQAHLELTSTEAVEYSGTMLRCTVGDLKARGFFESMWQCFEAGLRRRSISSGVVGYAKDVAAAGDELTLEQVLEKVQQSVTLDRQSLKIALFKFPPPVVCPSCGDQSWTFVLLSQNEKSVTWKCRRCGKAIVLGTKREPIPKEVQLEVWRRDEGKCVNCGSKDRLEYDHVIPRSRGGSNTPRNIQLLCENCNRTKAAKDPGDY